MEKRVATRDSVYGAFRRHKLDITKIVPGKNILAVEVFRAQQVNRILVLWVESTPGWYESRGIFREVRV